MYRPTVRYHDYYKNYVDELFKATTLDRNQIIRLALFTASHSDDFVSILNKYKKGDVPLPHSQWSTSDHQLWMESSPKVEERGKDVNDDNRRKTSNTKVNGINERGTGENEQHRRQQQTERQQREIFSRTETGGISIRIG
jgi:hypothetical protein